jgi:UDP-2,3-diacylglucosamine pyrophosphatase LpxH
LKKYLKIIDAFLATRPYTGPVEFAKTIIAEAGLDVTLARFRNYVAQRAKELGYVKGDEGGKPSGKASAAATPPPVPPTPGEDELEVDVDPEEAPYEVVNGHYVWSSKGKTKGSQERHFRMSVADVDRLFFEYSGKGLNLSQKELINKYNLSTWEWNSLKARLDLAKLANVFSPHTEKTTPPEELAAMMEEKIGQRYDNPGAILQKSYENRVAKEYNKVIGEGELNRFLNKIVLAELGDLLQPSRTRFVKRSETAPNAPEFHLASLADIHMGAETKGLQLSSDFDLKILYGYADQFIETVNAVGAKKTYLACIGDLIESFSGMSHPDSWKGMEKGMYGAKAIAAATEFIEYILQRVHNVAGILGVAGNHDRGSASNKEDTRGEIAAAIFYFLERMYGNVMEVRFEFGVLPKVIDGIRYILVHGDKSDCSGPAKVQQLVWDYGSRDMFNVVLSAHLHSRMINLDKVGVRWYVVPPLFTGNWYSERLGFTSVAGTLLFRNNGRGLPSVRDESFAVAA